MEKLKRDTNIIDEYVMSKFDYSDMDILNYNLPFELADVICNYTKSKYAVPLNGGSSGLLLGMMALGLKEGDEIIIPNYGYPAAYNISKFLKLNVILCDINYDTMCLDVDLVKYLVTENTKAIVYIEHIGYLSKDILKLQNFCREKNIYLIEDSAQALGYSLNGIMAGNFGDFGIYSFSGDKLIKGSEGGCLVTDNKDIYDYVIDNRNMIISNFSISSISAKFIIHQFKYIDYILNKRKQLNDLYLKYIKILYNDEINNTLHTIAIKTDNALKIHNELIKHKIMSRYNYYPCLNNISKLKIQHYVESFYDVTFSPYYIEPKIKTNTVGERLYDTYLELPQCDNITENDVKRIAFIIDSIKNNNMVIYNIMNKIERINRVN